MIELKVPTLGESVTEATVGTWFKKVGDNIVIYFQQSKSGMLVCILAILREWKINALS